VPDVARTRSSAQLEQERRQTIERIIALESAGVKPVPGARADVHARALALFAGEPSVAAVADDVGAELARLFQHRDVLDEAIALARRREEELRIEFERREMARLQPEITASIRKRALLALALVRANQEFEIFRRRFGDFGLASAGFRLGGTGAELGNEIYRCVEELARRGILTPKEAELP